MVKAVRSPISSIPWGWARAGAALGLACLAIAPVRWVQAGPSLCLVKSLTGRECLACGMTRALSCLLHGDLGAALTYHPASVAVLPLIVLFVVFPSRKKGVFANDVLR